MFDGKIQTLPQMGRYLELTDRKKRQQAWETVSTCRFKVKNDVEQIYDRLVKLRHTVARNAGYKNFRDYCHQRYCRFDYTPNDCFTFHDGVEEVVVPAVRRIMERRRTEMGLDALRPWDLAVDPLGREPLQPFRNGKELAKLSERVFRKVDPELGNQFRTMVQWELLDLDNRPGKEPGGYQTTLTERRLPFIFMNAVGRDGDVRTLLHEGGHAFHTMATRDEPVLDYRHAPMEFCEVASMSMELLANPHTGVFYPKHDEHRRSTQYLLEGIVTILPWIATIDAFQQWVYTHPDHARTERRAAWMKLRKRFGDGADWTGLEKYEEVLWHRQLHLFHYPFYYIEYGVAQLGALMVWRRALKNPAAALGYYKRALALGGSVGLRDLFRAAGGQLDFSARTIRPLVETVMEQLGY
jgi:oligoendopeptidase F